MDGWDGGKGWIECHAPWSSPGVPRLGKDVSTLFWQLSAPTRPVDGHLTSNLYPWPPEDDGRSDSDVASVTHLY